MRIHANMAGLSAGGFTGVDPQLDMGIALLKNYVYEQVCRHGDSDAEVTRSQLGSVELCDPYHKRLALCLQKIHDDLEGNVQLQRMLNNSCLQPTEDIFNKVALQIFSDGQFNWGRVVALYYFAYRLIVKALLQKKPEIISPIISWTISFIKEHAINWIREQGGWDGIFFGTPTWQATGVFLAGVLTAFLVIWKK